MTTLNVGVIGCGTISSAHFKSIDSIKEMKLFGITDHDYTKAEELGYQYRCKVYRDNYSLISDPEIDIIVLLTPPGNHSSLITLCAENQKHILVEKPIGINSESINNSIKVCEKKNVVLSVVSQHRFDKATEFAKQKISQNYLGNIVGVNCLVNWYRDDDYYQSWRGLKQLAGGGVLAIQAIHTIDLMLSLVGKVESLKAYVDNLSHPEVEVEDTAMTALKFSNGALGVISATTSSFPGYPAKLDIMGTDGSITIEGDEIIFYQSTIDRQIIRKSSNNETVSDPSQVSIESISAQYKDLLKSIHTGIEPRVTPMKAQRAFKLLEAIYESSDSGKEIYLSNKDIKMK